MSGPVKEELFFPDDLVDIEAANNANQNPINLPNFLDNVGGHPIQFHNKADMVILDPPIGKAGIHDIGHHKAIHFDGNNGFIQDEIQLVMGQNADDDIIEA